MSNRLVSSANSRYDRRAVCGSSRRIKRARDSFGGVYRVIIADLIVARDANHRTVVVVVDVINPDRRR